MKRIVVLHEGELSLLDEDKKRGSEGWKKRKGVVLPIGFTSKKEHPREQFLSFFFFILIKVMLLRCPSFLKLPNESCELYHEHVSVTYVFSLACCFYFCVI